MIELSAFQLLFLIFLFVTLGICIGRELERFSA